MHQLICYKGNRIILFDAKLRCKEPGHSGIAVRRDVLLQCNNNTVPRLFRRMAMGRINDSGILKFPRKAIKEIKLRRINIVSN